MRQSTTGTVLILGAATGFGTIGIFGEIAAASGLPLATLLPVRFLLATLIVLTIARGRNWSLPDTRQAWLASLSLGIVYTGMTVTYFTSLRYLTAGLATVVLYTYPIIVVVIAAVVLREPTTRYTLGAILCTTAGVALVVGANGAATGTADASTTASVSPVGVGLALAAATGYAIYTAGSRLTVGTIDPRSLMIGALVGTTVSMAVYGGLAGGLALPRGTQEWGITVGLAVVGTVVPLVLFYEGVQRLAATRVGIVSTVEPVVTVVLGALLLDEPVTVNLVGGGALVLAGVVLVQRTHGNGRPPADLQGPLEREP